MASGVALAFSPDGRRLASGGADHVVKVSRVPDFTEEAQFVGHTAPVWSVAFSPDGEFLASGGDVPIGLYRVGSTAAEPVASAGATEYATALLFSRDGRYLVSALADNVQRTPGAVKVWRVSR